MGKNTKALLPYMGKILYEKCYIEKKARKVEPEVRLDKNWFININNLLSLDVIINIFHSLYFYTFVCVYI